MPDSFSKLVTKVVGPLNQVLHSKKNLIRMPKHFRIGLSDNSAIQFDSTSVGRIRMSSTLRGSLLVAAKSLRDPNFYKTVILMLEHSSDGAAGVVLNRPSSVKVSDALAGQFELPCRGDVIFLGGPVEPTALMLLHNSEADGISESSPTDGVFIGGSADTFESVLKDSLNGDNPDVCFRVFAGYAGWGAGQLESEIERGDWLSTDCCPELVFGIDPYEMYDVVLDKAFAAGSLLPYRLKDPSVN